MTFSMGSPSVLWLRAAIKYQPAQLRCATSFGAVPGSTYKSLKLPTTVVWLQIPAISCTKAGHRSGRASPIEWPARGLLSLDWMFDGGVSYLSSPMRDLQELQQPLQRRSRRAQG